MIFAVKAKERKPQMTDNNITITRKADGTYTVSVNGNTHNEVFDTQLDAAEFADMILFSNDQRKGC